MPGDKLFLGLASGVAKMAGRGKAIIMPVPEGAVRIAYGTKCHENMDVYYPQNVENANIIFTIHGGGWMMGDTTMFASQCLEASQQGYIAVSFDYEKCPEGAVCADMYSEITQALTVLKQELAKKGNCRQKIVIAGHSAGAQLALCYAYSKAGECPYDIAFVVANSAPSDFMYKTSGRKTDIEKGTNIVLTMLTGLAVTKSNLEREDVKQAVKRINAVSLINENVAPTIVVHGNDDTMVSYEYSVRLSEKLCAAGVDSTFITYNGANHFLENNPEGKKARAEAFRIFEQKYL